MLKHKKLIGFGGLGILVIIILIVIFAGASEKAKDFMFRRNPFEENPNMA